MTTRSSSSSPDQTGTVEAKSSGRLTRRQALESGAVALGALALDTDPAAAQTMKKKEHGSMPGGRFQASFDEGWLFHRGDVRGAQAPSFDDSSWRKLDVPHDWQIEDLPNAPADADGGATADPSGFAFETGGRSDGTPPAVIGPFDAQKGTSGQGYTVVGVGWYRKHFTVPSLPTDERDRGGLDGDEFYELLFDGVYRNADVWLNGTHLGFHPYGYTSFAYDLTPYLRRHGKNVLAVRVDTSGTTSRWYSGSGIYRHTWLTVTGPVRIPLWGVYVTTPVVGEAQSVVRAEVQVNGRYGRRSARVRVTVLDARGRRVASRVTRARTVSSGGTATFAAEIPVRNVALWSPESPNLYTARAEVLVGSRIVDTLDTTFGIRSVVWNGSDGFLLNGKQVKINGGNIHDDHGPLGVVALNRSEHRKIEVLKAAGLNAIRTSHHPRNPYQLEVCDRLGMLVWNEFSDEWDISKGDGYSQYFPDWWQRDLTSMILRDRNHPSVIIWSIGNEIIFGDPNGYGPKLAALVRSLDNTRPVSLGGEADLGPHAGPDPSSYVDVIDTHGAPELIGPTFHAHYPDKAFSQSENQASTIYGDWQYALQAPWFVGSWVWAGWDYIGEPGSGATVVMPSPSGVVAAGGVLGTAKYPWYVDFQCDIDLIGQRKPQSYYRAVVVGQSPLELFVVRPTPPGTQQQVSGYSWYDELESWTWDVPQGQSMTVHVYTSGDTVRLLLNGSQVGAHAMTSSDQQIATLSAPYTPGELTAIASRGGKEIARKTLTTAGTAAGIRLTSDVSALTTRRDDLSHVLVEVIDRAGRRVPDDVRQIHFKVTGTGELIGVASGNPHNVDSFKRPRRYTWHGQALAILRPAKTAGTLTLTASAQGLQPTTVTLPVKAAAHPHPHKKHRRHPAGNKRHRHPPRVKASLASLESGPALVLALGAAVLRRRMQSGLAATPSPNTPQPGKRTTSPAPTNRNERPASSG